MKAISYIEFQMTDSGMEEVYRDDHHYDGPWERTGGGPSDEQKQAAAANANLSNKLADVFQQNENYTETQRNKTTPFYSNLMVNGPEYTGEALDAASGTGARAFAPARARLLRSLGPSTGLPSGFRMQALTDFDESQARDYEDRLAAILADRQAARERGAAGLMGEAQQANPLGYAQGAMQGNQSILQAPLQRPGAAGLIGGILGGAMQAIPA